MVLHISNMYRIRDCETKGFVQGIRWTVHFPVSAVPSTKQVAFLKDIRNSEKKEKENLQVERQGIDESCVERRIYLRGGGIVFPREPTVPFETLPSGMFPVAEGGSIHVFEQKGGVKGEHVPFVGSLCRFPL